MNDIPSPSYTLEVARPVAALCERVKSVVPEAEVTVRARVHFMAETAKLLSPQNTGALPDFQAGCSLAPPIAVLGIRLVRETYPDLPVSPASKLRLRCRRIGNLLKVDRQFEWSSRWKANALSGLLQ